MEFGCRRSELDFDAKRIDDGASEESIRKEA
jgi:hypothetical protein